MSLTFVQLHFVKGVINHRLRFGQPDALTKLDSYRSLATFKEASVFGYIRWRANEYGTQDWRVYVLKTQIAGYLSEVPGIASAVKVLLNAQGAPAVKRCLSALDTLEKEAGGSLEAVSESYWPRFSNALLLRNTPRSLPRNLTQTGAQHAQ